MLLHLMIHFTICHCSLESIDSLIELDSSQSWFNILFLLNFGLLNFFLIFYQHFVGHVCPPIIDLWHLRFQLWRSPMKLKIWNSSPIKCFKHLFPRSHLAGLMGSTSNVRRNNRYLGKGDFWGESYYSHLEISCGPSIGGIAYSTCWNVISPNLTSQPNSSPPDRRSGRPSKEGGGPLNNLLSGGDTRTH